VATPRASATPGPTGSTAQKELSRTHREWFDQVTYIIDDREKAIFEALGTEWQRNRFIDAFWKRRDPVPVTPENEFQIEHIRRWEHANKVIGRDTPMPGSRTDRGRVYIVNGPPFRVHPYPNTQQLWPLEVWEYRDTPRPGMPPFYQIIFFKPRVFNEWRLYSPSVDGPTGLVIGNPSNMSHIDLRQLASKFPIVFLAAQRVAPGYGALGSETVIARTMAPAPPPRPLSLYYTPDGEVDSTFLTAAALDVRIDATGYSHRELEGYVDVAVELPTTETVFIEVDGRKIANFEIELEIETPTAGTWRNTSGSVVVRIPQEDFEEVRDLPILSQQRLWLLPGSYKVRALLTEVATGRIGVAEAVAVVPEPADLVVSQPTLFYVKEDGAIGRAIGDWRAYIPWVGSQLRRGSPVACLVRISRAGDNSTRAGPAPPEGLEIGYELRQAGRVMWSDTWAGQPEPRSDADGWGVARTLQIGDLPAGSYELLLRARVSGSSEAPTGDLGIIGRRQIELVDDFLPLPRILPMDSDTDTTATAHHQIGQQLLRRDDFSKARAHFESAVRLEPDNAAFQIDAAKTLVLAGELTMAEFLLERATRNKPNNPAAWATLGLLRIQKGEFPGAIEAYARSLDAGPGTPSTYNGLAEAFLSTGDAARALEMLELSLELNPAQQQVRQLRDQLKNGDE
jgi:GWxTD domain-containing protein